ncbi:MAG: hypothetical protein KJO33_05445, partial [Gammaproteobacteria bacterium]|nr:hypothetical protein [Gammaproteobacteria bacterium]
MKLREDLMLFGPNRRHPQKPVIELWLEPGPNTLARLQGRLPGLRAAILDTLAGHGVRLPSDHPVHPLPGESPLDALGRLVAGVALGLQQHAGHRVDFFDFVASGEDGVSSFVFEYEENDTGDDARAMALHLVGELEPDLALEEPLIAGYSGFAEPFQAFMAVAPQRVLPRDAQAIIDAAARLDVPCVKLEREPYAGVSGDFRVRPNGLLKLGHACRQQVLDGTFCVYRNEALAPLVHDREAVHKTLLRLGAPLPSHDANARRSVSSRRAARVAERIGFPVAIKPLGLPRSAGDAGIALDLADADAVRKAAERALRLCRGVRVEAHVPGETYKLIVANGECVAVVRLQDGLAREDVTADAHASTIELAQRLAAELQPGLMTVTVVSRDIGSALVVGGAVVSLDVAPELDAFLRGNGQFPGPAILGRAMEGLVRFLFPDPAKSRIPIIAVTGTNGKTTVCGMISRIVQSAGHVTGRAGTTGFFVNDECRQFEDFSGGSGHYKVLEAAEVDFAVLESARGAATDFGFMYDWSDVAVCTNVTADHLFERGIDSVEQMAGLKLLIVDRARHAVVLNADNAASAGMLGRLPGRRAWMVSASSGPGELRERFGADVDCVVAEPDGDVEWLVIYDGDRRIPVLPVGQVPVTLEGRLRYNVSNTLQTIAACYQQGISIDVI